MLGRNSLGDTFGGLTLASWGGNSWCSTDACSGDFLFRLGPGAAAVYRPKPGGGTHYQGSQPRAWPRWGQGTNLRFGLYGALGQSAFCNQGYTYEGAPDEVCGGKYVWGATEMEVWYRVN